jgi:hypothetical protein
MTLFCNNQAALQLTTADNYHVHTKHINTCYHFICQTIKDGSIILIYCPTDNITADILTKALPHWKVATHALGLGLHHASREVLDSGTPGEDGAEVDGMCSSTGGRIAHSTIADQPVTSGSTAHAKAHSGVHT